MRLTCAVLITLAAAGCTGIPQTSGPSQNGALCGASSECGSGQCVDGVCCESACDGACRSCAVTGSEGRCVDVPEGLDPARDCGSGVCAGSCDGQGACRYPASEKSCGAALCVGAAVETPVCDGAGACSQSSQPCAPFGCEAGACKTSCADPSDCAGAALCLPAGQCEDKLPNGSPCGSGTACASNFCADGVCCDSVCGGTCESCNLPGAAGACSAVAAGEDPANECTGTQPCGSSCDGNRQCVFGAQGTVCGGSFCSSADSPQINRQCNGAGQCTDVLQACGLYACEGAACRTTCTTNAECRANSFCDVGSNQCVARRVLGESCTAAAECASNFCADGVCCNTGCGGACNSCVGETRGICTLLGVGAAPVPACANAGQACGQINGCPATCSATAPCLPTHYCNAGSCTLKASDSSACTTDAQCQSGFCSDGVCCDQNCDDTSCKSCAVAGSVGACVPLSVGFEGASPVCAGQYACRSDGSCGNGPCSSDGECKATAYCAGAAGCLPRKPAGSTQTCSRARECASNFCVDGFCCNSACTNTCEACNLQGNQSLCTAVPNSTDPHSECAGGLACNGARGCYSAPCAAGECEPGFICGADGACTPGKARGATCASTSECGPTLSCTDGVCCNEGSATCGACESCNVAGFAGTCVNVAPRTDPGSDCAGGLTCNGSGACQTGCSTNVDCEAGYACQGGACVLLKVYGAACAAPAECQSGFCADGVCCDGACTSGCAACNFPGQVGSCTNYPAGSNPGNVCPGSNACDGFGACGTACTVDSQCSAGSFCNVNTCTPKLTNSTACTSDNQCVSNTCVDGVCCDLACGGLCQTCNAPGYPRGVCSSYGARQDPEADCAGGFACQQVPAGACFTTCTNDNACELAFFCQGGQCVSDLAQGGACTSGEQCLSGYCEDGVCCDRACEGSPCEACNSPSTIGVCTAHGNLTDPEARCTGTFCDGMGACISPCPNDSVCKGGYYCETNLPTDTCVLRKRNGDPCVRPGECTSNQCVDGVCCDTGCTGTCESCAVGNPGTCTPYAFRTDPENECGNATCVGNNSACIMPCTAEADCKAGFYCNAGACVAKKANGTACSVGTPSGTECQSGNCVDGFCCDTQCAGGCDRCDTLPGTCSVLPVGTPAACSPYVCGGGPDCPSSCAAQSDCQSGFYCDVGGTNQCLAQKTTATACGGPLRGFECTSGFCADGVCCSTACTQACAVCNATPGTCTAAVAGTDPGNDCQGYTCDSAGACRTTCADDTQCAQTHFCDGAACVPKLTGPNQPCTRERMCDSGFCTDGYCCNQACGGSCDRCDQGDSTQRGTCTPMGTTYAGDPVCAPYRCTDGADCTSVCANDSDCATTAYCSGTTCLLDESAGASCTRAEQCATNFCEQTRCCTTACDPVTAPCGSCNVTGTEGTCSPVGSAATPTGVCGEYLCQSSSTACPTSCISDADCRTSGFCDTTTSTCQADLGAGATCVRDAQCANGNCQGVSCN